MMTKVNDDDDDDDQLSDGQVRYLTFKSLNITETISDLIRY